MPTKPRKLKVYEAQFGFHDSVVAAPNQAAALKAWGVRQNLFAEGGARLCEDADAVTAALLHPETPLRRTVGTKNAFELEPKDLPVAPKSTKTATSDPKTASAKANTPKPGAQKPPPDRSALSAAESRLRSLEAERRLQEASFRKRQEALAREETEAQSAYVASRRNASEALETVRRRFIEAGGDPSKDRPSTL